MKKLLSATISCLIIAPALAQNGWLPDVYLQAGRQLCDYEPYKLVFYDNFDGDTLKKPWDKI